MDIEPLHIFIQEETCVPPPISFKHDTRNLGLCKELQAVQILAMPMDYICPTYDFKKRLLVIISYERSGIKDSLKWTSLVHIRSKTDRRILWYTE